MRAEFFEEGEVRRGDGVDAGRGGDGMAIVSEERPIFGGHGEALIGQSPAFLRVLRKIPRLAASDATVLITGDTGTGKELIAEAIHNCSNRRGRAFIAVNCGALPEELVENELFGHARGAYTGAAATGKGLLAEAEGGTLFLDELNSLSLSAQAKILRFLQNREYRMLGSTKLLRANVRIIAATNVDLRKHVDQSLFRADLFHRLHVLSIELPPLRERLEDIPLLAQHFLGKYARDYGKGTMRLSPAALRKLSAYPWYGNVRELQSVLERSVLLAGSPELQADDVDLPMLDTPEFREDELEDEPEEARSGAEALGQREATTTFREAKERMIRQFERTYLIQVMGAAQGNVSRAARLAGMQRRDFQRLLRKHDVRRPEPRGWFDT
ncbi:MAG TPA: sigma 54-interacting transcriptional regulator [Candidatus Limnocylindrales bacterium]|nr:sigma 54-interacting transcriptional regulator [Candidatus Limnocylindrales bacterium]